MCPCLCNFETCNTNCEGNRKLLEWMRGKRCDMRQVGGGAGGAEDGETEGAEAAVNTLSLEG